jgi:D-galacturonate reductase
MNIVVIGTGMYSTGRGTDSYGTILPGIIEWQRNFSCLGEVCFVGTNGNNSASLKAKSETLMADTGVNIDVSFMPKSGTIDANCYKKVISQIARPACAIIVVPDHLHFQVAKDCLNSDLPVLLVKPLTPSLKEAKLLVDLAENRSLYASVEFHKRYDKANLMLKDRLQSKKLGDPLYFWVEYSQRKSIPTKIFKEWVEKTSILQYLGVHYIDIVRFVTNAMPIRVMALGQKNWLPSQGLDAYDSIQSFIEWRLPNGKLFSQTILTNWIDPESSSAMSDQKIKFVGTNGRFESDQKQRGITIDTDSNGIEQPNPDFCHEYGYKIGRKEWRGYGIDSVKEFLTDVFNINSGLITKEEIQFERPIFSEAMISTAVVEAAHNSLANDNIWININI